MPLSTPSPEQMAQQNSMMNRGTRTSQGMTSIMATTATNKQPLLIDRIFHFAKNITGQKTGGKNRFTLSCY